VQGAAAGPGVAVSPDAVTHARSALGAEAADVQGAAVCPVAAGGPDAALSGRGALGAGAADVKGAAFGLGVAGGALGAGADVVAGSEACGATVLVAPVEKIVTPSSSMC